VFKDGWSPGFALGATVGFTATPVVTIEGGVEYARFGLDVPSEISDSVDGGALSIFYVSGGFRFTAGSAETRPSLLGGLGFYRVSASDATAGSLTIEGHSENAAGIHFGAGLGSGRFPLDELYRIGFTEGESTGDFVVRAGLALSGN
jgi:hypothetical protein